MFDMVDNYDTECPNMIRKIVKVCLLLGKIVQIFIQFDEFFGKISVRIGDFFFIRNLLGQPVLWGWWSMVSNIQVVRQRIHQCNP